MATVDISFPEAENAALLDSTTIANVSMVADFNTSAVEVLGYKNIGISATWEGADDPVGTLYMQCSTDGGVFYDDVAGQSHSVEGAGSKVFQAAGAFTHTRLRYDMTSGGDGDLLAATVVGV